MFANGGAYPTPFHRPYGSVGVGRTFPPQMNAEILGRSGVGTSPRAITIPLRGSRRRSLRFPSSPPVFMSRVLIVGCLVPVEVHAAPRRFPARIVPIRHGRPHTHHWYEFTAGRPGFEGPPHVSFRSIPCRCATGGRPRGRTPSLPPATLARRFGEQLGAAARIRRGSPLPAGTLELHLRNVGEIPPDHPPLPLWASCFRSAIEAEK